MSEKKQQPKDPLQKRGLTDDDADLWRKVTETAAPIEKEDDQVFEQLLNDSQKTKEIRDRKKDEQKNQARMKERSSPGPEKSFSSIPIKPLRNSPPPLADFDRRQKRQLASGRQKIEATLDLHGFRQREAYQALKSFLFNAQAEGYRHVLIITGKGRPPAEERSLFSGEDEPGVLKRQLPHWLGEGEFRQMVTSYSQAGLKHGGEGALYIQLRRRKT